MTLPKGAPVGAPEEAPGAAELRREQLAGQKVAPVGPTVVEIGGRDVELPGTLPTYATAPPTYQEQPELEQLPGYDRLTRTERWISDRFAGIPGPLREAMEWFSKSPFGKALMLLDVGAEGMERLTGLGAQAGLAAGGPGWDEFTRDLKSAWYAGSLSYDVWDSPIYQDGRWIMPGDMPGASALVRARQDISARVAQGESYQDATVAVRDQLYEDLGALALRAQLSDAKMHIVADPINFLLPYIKPVESIRRFANTRLIFRATSAAVGDAEAIVARLDDVARVAAQLDEARRVGTAEDVARLSGQLADAQKLAGVEDVARLPEIIADAQRVATEIRAAQLPPWQEKFADILGFNPAKPGVLAGKWNPLALTPAARAYEIVDVIVENIRAHVFHLPPGEAVRAIERAADGALDPRLGHMVTSIEGRSSLSVLKQVRAHARDLMEAYELTGAVERPIINVASQVLGENPGRIAQMLRNGDAPLIATRLAEAAQESPEVARALELIVRSGARDPLDALERAAIVFRDLDLYTDDLFKAQLVNKIADAAAEYGVTMFGVKAAGVFQQAADALKAAESLAFLRLNASWPVQNWMNNTVTMLARGVYGNPFDDPVRLVDKIGFEPIRFREGWTAADETPFNDFFRVLDDAARGKKTGLRKVENFIRGAKLGPFDAGAWAKKIEARSSMRAYSAAYTKFYPQIWREARTGFREFNPQVAEALGEAAVRRIDDVVGSSWKPDDMGRLFEPNLNLNAQTIIDDAERALGYPIERALGREFLTAIEDGLTDAARRGTVPEYLDEVRAWIRNSLDEGHARSLDTIAEAARARVEAEGAVGVARMMGSIWDDFFSAHSAHARQVSRLARAARSMPADAAGGLWRAQYQADEAFFGRTFDRMEATVRGIGRAGTRFRFGASGEVLTAFKQWRKGWTDFFAMRKKLVSGYFEARAAGESPLLTWNKIQDELDTAYRAAANSEAEVQRGIEQLVLPHIPTNRQPVYLAWRQTVADIRQLDRQAVLDFRRNLETLLPDEVEDAWRVHWQERQRYWGMMANEERLGSAAMTGDPAAAARYEQLAEPYRTQATERLAALTDVETARTGEELVDALRRAQDRYDIRILTAEEAAALPERRYAQIRLPPHAGRLKPGERIPIDITPEGMQLSAEALRETLVHEIGHHIGRRFPAAVQHIFGGQEERVADALISWLRGELGVDELEALRRAATGQLQPGDYAEAIAQFLSEDAEIHDLVRALGRGLEPNFVGVPDLDVLVPRQLMHSVGLDQAWYMSGEEALRALGESAQRAARQPAVAVPAEFRPALESYIAQATGEMGDARYASMRMAEYGRDTALLNYRRRVNFDTWAGFVYPYHFWITHSAFTWALQSLDRPAMLSTFLRMKKLLYTGFRPEENMPQRLRGRVRIELPFLGEWAGADEFFVDPLAPALPFGRFQFAGDTISYNLASDQAATQRALDELLGDGTITPEAHAEAMSTRSGAAWERAQLAARQDDSEGRLNAFDFSSMLTSPHAPIMWAMNAWRDTPEKIGPFLPLTRTLKGITSVLGIGPPGGVNIEARVRRELGLPEFDEWEDYRVERALAGMVAEGRLTADVAIRAMVDHAGEAWEQAKREAGRRSGLGIVTAIAGIPMQGYPEGEETLRRLRDDHERAWQDYERGFTDAPGKFYDAHPEYRTQLALNREPEDRMRRFLIDEVWSTWRELPKLDRDEVREQLGPMFDNAFLSRETRSYDAIPTPLLGAWLKVMGGAPPGSLTTESIPPIELAPAHVARRAQEFFDYRNLTYPDWYRLQGDYFKLDKGAARREYVRQHPALADYWQWRRDWLARNPEVAPYLTDEPPTYPSEAALRQAQAAQPQFTQEELYLMLGGPLFRLLQDEEDLPAPARQRLEEIAEGLGVSPQQLISQAQSAP